MEQNLDVVCSEEQVTIGTLQLQVFGRMRLTPAVVWAGFRPASTAYQLAPRPQASGEYWRCPKCASVLVLPAAQYEPKDEPRGRAAMQPAVPAAQRVTREQARAEVAAKFSAHETVHGSGGEHLPIMLGVSTVVP